MRQESHVHLPSLAHLGLLLASICALSLPLSEAQAGNWSFQSLGPGASPDHVKIRITYLPQPTINCIDPCDYVTGSFEGRITPAPPTQGIAGSGCMEPLVVDETGADFTAACVSVSEGYFEIDLDPAQAYSINGSYFGGWLEGGCQGGACCPDDFCYGSDSSFVQLDIPQNPVGIQSVLLSTLKSRF